MDSFINKVTCGNCLDLMRELPDGCCSLAVIDGPYNMRKADWDKFDTWEDFRRFYVPVFNELSRVLRDNCSMYVFGTFEGLAALKPALDDLGGGWKYRQVCTWDKGLGAIAGRTSDMSRMYPNRTEFCLFYARERVDISSLAWDGVTREDNTIREYLNAERERAGISVREVAEEYQKVTGSRTVTGMAGHWFCVSQWTIPTEANYLWLRKLFNSRGGGPYLRREYEDLRREYEDLRYTFNPQKGVTDVWDAPICAGKERLKVDGKTAHVAQKPLSIIERIITSSSNEGDTVIDPFAGTGTTGVACYKLNRQFIGMELSPEYADIANARIEHQNNSKQKVLFNGG